MSPPKADLHPVPQVDRADEQGEVALFMLVELRLEKLVVGIRHAPIANVRETLGSAT